MGKHDSFVQGESFRDFGREIKGLRSLKEAQNWIRKREEIYYKFLDTRDIIAFIGKNIGEFYKAYVTKEVYPNRWWGGSEGAESMEEELADILHWCLVLSNRLNADLGEVIAKIEGFKEEMSAREIQESVKYKYRMYTSIRQNILLLGSAFGELCKNFLEGKVKQIELLPSLEKIALWCFSAANAINVDLFEAWKSRQIPGR